MMNEMSSLVQLFIKASQKDNSDIYFDYFEKTLRKSGLSIAAVHSDGFTPIHQLISSHKSKSSTIKYINKLTKLCSRYSQWLTIKNVHNHIPLLVAIQKSDFDAFFCLCRYMLNVNSYNLLKIISSKIYVEGMISFGCFLLDKRKTSHLSLLLKCFDYFEIFYYPSRKTHPYNIINNAFVVQQEEIKNKEEP
eukprot:74750_1